MHYEKDSVSYLSHIVTNVMVTGCKKAARYVGQGIADLGVGEEHI